MEYNDKMIIIFAVLTFFSCIGTIILFGLSFFAYTNQKDQLIMKAGFIFLAIQTVSFLITFFIYRFKK